MPKELLQNKKPIAVLISDVHYNLSTLEKADKAVGQARDKAEELEIPLIVAGDLHDTKANLRGECVNKMLHTFTSSIPIYVLRGNHCALHEKSTVSSLRFLRGCDTVRLIENPTHVQELGITFLPYSHDTEFLKRHIDIADNRIIMHQGVISADDTIQDHTAIPKEWLAGRRVISGHYHNRQQFELPGGGLFDYIGNPFSLGWGEADHPDKGYQILYSDGTLEFVSCGLPRHRVIRLDLLTGEQTYSGAIAVNDMVKVIVSGPSDKLTTVTKDEIRKLVQHDSVVLELQPTEIAVRSTAHESFQPNKLLDTIIDESTADLDRKFRLKKLWKTL